jgi:hypothetical protein
MELLETWNIIRVTPNCALRVQVCAAAFSSLGCLGPEKSPNNVLPSFNAIATPVPNAPTTTLSCRKENNRICCADFQDMPTEEEYLLWAAHEGTKQQRKLISRWSPWTLRFCKTASGLHDPHARKRSPVYYECPSPKQSLINTTEHSPG